MALIEGEKIGYCQKCAINVASNGFEVNKINSCSPKAGSNNKYFLGSPKSILQPFNFPEYYSAIGYENLKGIIGELDKVYSEYEEQARIFSTI